MRSRKRRLAIERLERRNLFAAFAVPWPEIDSLQLSFVHDGTQVGDSRSELFSLLNTSMPDVDWQLQMLTAFQTWAIQTDANIGLVGDQGQPIGTIGFKQGDLRFGDVRLGAFPMEQDVLAVANPYDPFIANSWVGDVFLNSKSSFLQDSKSQAQSLLSVMLHEAGHVFGIGHSTDTASPMYPFFQKLTTTLTPQDIAGLRSIYGERLPDRFEGELGNESITGATEVSLIDSQSRRSVVALSADISTARDIDTYAFVIPRETDSLSIELHASGKSLLTSNIAVLNERGEIVATRTSLDPRNNDLQLVVDQVQAGQRFYLQVRSADQSVFGIGRYELELTPQSADKNTEPALRTFGLQDLPVLAPEERMATTPGYVEHTYYELAGALSSANPSQRFRFHSPVLSDQLTNVFTIILSAEVGDINDLGIQVTDSNGVEVPMTLISAQDGKIELQVAGAQADVDYLATVFTKDLETPATVYELEVDFAHDGRQLQSLVSDSLSDTQPVYSRPLSIEQSGHYHFIVSSSDWSNPHESGATMRIRDLAGQVIAEANVEDGSSQWLDLFLNRGQYTFEFSSGGRLPGTDVLVQLAMESESSPIGPQLRDMSSKPVERVAAPPIDALMAHWLPGYRATESFQYAAASPATASNMSSPLPSQNSSVMLPDSARDAQNIGQSAPRTERAKPKKSELKAAPLREQTTTQSADPVQEVKFVAPQAAPEIQFTSTVSSHDLQDQVIGEFVVEGMDAEPMEPTIEQPVDRASVIPNSLTASIFAIGLAIAAYRHHRASSPQPQLADSCDSRLGRARKTPRRNFADFGG